jgi:hypothetical protein
MLAGSGWVELTRADDRYVCPHCAGDESASSK